MSFTPSPENLAIRDHICDTTLGNLMVVAVAGSGKTTTICWVLPFIPDAESKSILFMAFSKNIVTALEPRVPSTVSVKTGHALGLAAWKRHTGSTFRGKSMTADKVFDILKETLNVKRNFVAYTPRGQAPSSGSQSEFELYASNAKRLVGLAKSAGIGTVLLENTPSSWYHLISHNGLILDDNADEQRLVEIAAETLEKSNAQGKTVIDFDDMLYLPLLHNSPFDKKNYIFIDEAQDTNGVQRELLKRMLAAPPYGRLIAVGDPSQAIYGFRGADAEAMSTMQREFSMTVLPLSVSYRCSKAVVAEAQKYETVT